MYTRLWRLRPVDAVYLLSSLKVLFIASSNVTASRCSELRACPSRLSVSVSDSRSRCTRAGADASESQSRAFSASLNVVVAAAAAAAPCSLLLAATDQMVDGTTHLAPTFVRNAPSRREAVYASSFAFARVLRFVDVQPRSLESARKVRYADNDVAFRFLRISRSRRHLCIIIATD